MELVSQDVEDFSHQITSPANALLKKIEQNTYASHAQPHMLSGHVQGRLLSFLSQIAKPSYILEIGTFTGYSALCLAEGLTPEGQLHTIELREEDAQLAQSYFELSEYKNQITQHTGNALEIIPQLSYIWDIVFIDADKVNYIAYYKLAFERLQTNGFIIIDNILFHGKIFESPIKGKSAKAVAEFNQFVKEQSDSEKVMLSVRDGLLLIKKKKHA